MDAQACQKRLRISEYIWQSLLVFVVALIGRLVWSQLLLGHRIFTFEDGFYYLTTAREIAEIVIRSAGDPVAIWQSILPDHLMQPDASQYFASTRIADRLVLDGPVFPGYLALVMIASGMAKVNFAFDATSGAAFGIANSILDSLSCVLVYAVGRFLFGAATGLMAGLLYAVYPAAILNVPRCLGEQFAYFIFLLLLSLTLSAERWRRSLATSLLFSFSVGLVAALVILSKPLFVLMPPIMVLSLIVAERLCKPHEWRESLFNKQKIAATILSLLGAGLILCPWAFFTARATGKPVLLVNRAPAYNLFVGSRVDVDGWKISNHEVDSIDLSSAVQAIFVEAARSPFTFVSMEFRKVCRLWSGPWNDFQYELFKIPDNILALFHQLILLFAFGGAVAAVTTGVEHKERRQIFGSITLIGVIGVHFIYCLFEPISRYNLTAMPACAVLAAYFMVWCAQRRIILNLLLLSLAAAALFILHAQFHFLSAIVPIMGPNILMSRLMESCLFALGWAGLGVLLFHLNLRSGQKTKSTGAVIIYAAAAAAIIAFCSSYSDPAWAEWRAELKARRQLISQKLILPPTEEVMPGSASPIGTDATGFVLLDLASTTLAPQLTVWINGIQASDVCFPWYQLSSFDADINTQLSQQSSAMGRDWRGFRQWWAVPFRVSALKFGSENDVSVGVGPESPDTVLSLYGQYRAGGADRSGAAGGAGRTGGTAQQKMPSLQYFSWTKGFATWDKRDPRVYSEMPVRAKTGDATFAIDKDKQSMDLSMEKGVQSGEYRIRICVPISKDLLQGPDQPATASDAGHPEKAPSGAKAGAGLPAPAQRSSETPAPATFPIPDKGLLYATMSTHTVDGADPASFFILPRTIKLPSNMPSGTYFHLLCEHSAPFKKVAGACTMIFSGEREGQIVNWTPPWTPSAVETEDSWRYFVMADFIPDEILSLKDLKLQIMFPPCQSDLVILNKERAARENLAIRNLKLFFMPPMKLPPTNRRAWLIF